MADSTHSPQPNQKSQHETSDARMNPVLWFVAALVIFATVMQLLVIWFMFGLEKVKEDNTAPQPPIAAERPQFPQDLSEIPSPRLQEKEKADLQEMLDRDHKLLSSYGKSEDGAFRIPIQRAMELMAERDGKKK